MMKNIGNFMLGLTGICMMTIILVMGLVLFGFALSLFFALLPYVILGLLVAWVIKAMTTQKRI